MLHDDFQQIIEREMEMQGMLVGSKLDLLILLLEKIEYAGPLISTIYTDLKFCVPH